ncbi:MULTISPECIES: hypothetical protein [unclassified Rhizobium]|uniref:hypothetical protein n=1 Tax=unclassified Rhizobium TaxID=2613769 RepID=UPI0007E9E772|nr:MULTISPECIES: hypothetical protein [unclassified Rhizobium]ANM08558.1 hypothetical protein AMK05_CH00109 [Rhizobium sp. N324]ANM15069.1 hypothetical protein AMK06_CH00110 [Rhizobium sp. N541]ANM21457.1 hypothetical protein AMK07_CH00110 [Rhizobium sp. N941]OYD02121.1 hypothetical protein AMK08_CH100104 [Rhizobium sp. N4311]
MTSPETATPHPMTSAEDLRKRALELQLVEMERSEKIKAREAKKHAEFVEDFFRKQIGEAERAVIKRLVMKAAADGKYEALIYSFPSTFCTDSGRAINNNLPGWQKTLQGKAKEILELFEQVAKPQGYGLKAMIINFPDGMPGDVGFFLTWEPPVD